MAIGVDSVTNGKATDATVLNISVTPPANSVMVVSVEIRENSTPDREVDSVVFNTSESLLLGPWADEGSQVTSWKYYISNPTATTANVTITTKGECQTIYGTVVILTGADTDDPFDDGAYDSGTSDSSTTVGGSVDPGNANSFLVCGICLDDDDGLTMNAYSGRVERRNDTDPGDSESGASTRTTTSSGSYSMDWTKPATAESWAWTAIAINEAAVTRRVMIVD